MGQTIIQVIQYTCERCGFKWQPWKGRGVPKVCGRCKSYDWQKPKPSHRNSRDALGKD